MMSLILFKIQTCNSFDHEFGFSDQISQQEKAVRFIKLNIETFYGEGGGLRQLSFHGPPMSDKPLEGSGS